MMTKQTHEEALWRAIYRGARNLLSRHGLENAFGEGDFWILDDDWGNGENLIYVFSLALMRPPVILGLQALLKEAPGRTIVVALDMKKKGCDWPPMGLVIQRHEIVDELKREHLPPEWQALHYPGARPRDSARDPQR